MKYTVVSCYPFDVKENFPTVYPGYFELAPGDPLGKHPQVLRVPEGIQRARYIRDGETMYIPVPEEQVAAAICRGSNTVLGYEPDAMPALFFVPDHLEEDQVVSRHKSEIKEAIEKQNRWFTVLVKLADDEWTKYHQHKMISDQMRYAAVFLGVDREWAKEATADSQKKCPACMSFVDIQALICRFCRTIIDAEGLKRRNLVQLGT